MGEQYYLNGWVMPTLRAINLQTCLFVRFYAGKGSSIIKKVKNNKTQLMVVTQGKSTLQKAVRVNPTASFFASTEP